MFGSNLIFEFQGVDSNPLQHLQRKKNRRCTQRYLDRIYRIDRIFSYSYPVHPVILSIKGKRQLNTHISKVPAHDMNPCNNQRK